VSKPWPHSKFKFAIFVDPIFEIDFEFYFDVCIDSAFVVDDNVSKEIGFACATFGIQLRERLICYWRGVVLDIIVDILVIIEFESVLRIVRFVFLHDIFYTFGYVIVGAVSLVDNTRNIVFDIVFDIGPPVRVEI